MKKRADAHKVALLSATWSMLFSEDRFAQHYRDLLERSRAQAMEDIQRTDGRPHHSTPAGERLSSDEARNELQLGLLNAFLVACVALFLAVGIALTVGTVHPSRSLDAGKLLQAVGGALAIWGTIFAVKSPPKSLGGLSVPEQVHTFLFTTLLGIGGALALTGTLI
jgi:hypothetical protein